MLVDGVPTQLDAVGCYVGYMLAGEETGPYLQVVDVEIVVVVVGLEGS